MKYEEIKKMTFYIIFGDWTEQIAEFLSERYEIIGQDRTIDAACAAISQLEKHPDVFLIMGTAIVTRLLENSLNYGDSLIKSLKVLRMSCPRSRIILILPDGINKSVIQGILYLGIYDIHIVNQLNVEELVNYIENPKTIADWDLMVQAEQDKIETSIKVTMPEDEQEEKSKHRILTTVKGLLKQNGNTGDLNSELKGAKQNNKIVNIHSKRPSKIIGILSPRSCGVTFTAVNLAAVLAELGQEVALVDFKGDCKTYFFPPKVTVYSSLNEAEYKDYVIVDAGSKKLKFDRAVIVYSPELYYIDPVKELDKTIQCPCIRVLNKAISLPGSYEKLLGIIPDVVVPYTENLFQILTGRPAVLDHPHIKQSFIKIANLVRQQNAILYDEEKPVVN